MTQGLKLAAVLAVAAPLASCAVTRIDVDVYKGPLADHEDVQIQRLASMADGAGPLLVRLQGSLCEKAVPDGNNDLKAHIIQQCQILEKDVVNKHRLTQALSEINSECYIDHQKKDECDLLEIVIGIRRLYHDLDDLDPLAGELARVSQELEGYIADFGKNYAILDPLSRGNPTIRQKKLAAELRRLHPVSDPSTQDPAAKLAIAYLAFLTPPESQLFRRPGDVVEASGPIDRQGAFSDDTFELLKTRDKELRGNFSTLSTNTAFELLERVDLLKLHADILFPEPPAAKTEPEAETRKEEFARARTDFVSEVSRIARSYSAARWTYAQGLTKVLRTIRDLGPELRIGEEQETKILRLMADSAAKLIHTRHLMVALWGDDVGSEVKLLRERLLNEFRVDRDQLRQLSPFQGHTAEDQRLIRLSLSNLLYSYPARLAEALLNAQNQFLSDDFSISTADTKIFESSDRLGDTQKRYDETPSRRRYGLSRGLGTTLLTLERTNYDDIRDAANTLRSLQNASSGGVLGAFDRGRLPDGLYTLKKKALEETRRETIEPCNAVRPCAISDSEGSAPAMSVRKSGSAARGTSASTNDGTVWSTRGETYHRLYQEALVRFAQRVLFVVNHEALFTGGSSDANTRTYVRVLQAVGNSIIIQADELIHRAGQAENISDGTLREIRAYAAALDEDPEEYLAGLVSGFVSLKSAATARLANLKSALGLAGTWKGEVSKEEGAKTTMVSWVTASEILNESGSPPPPEGPHKPQTIEARLKILEGSLVNDTEGGVLRDGIVNIIKDEADVQGKANKRTRQLGTRKVQEAHENRVDRLETARETLEGLDVNKLKDIKGEEAKDKFPAFIKVIEQEGTAAISVADAAERARREAESKLDEALDALGLRRAGQSPDEVVTTISGEETEEDKKLTRLNHTVEILKDTLKDGLKGLSFESAAGPVGARRVYFALIDHLDEELETERNSNTAKATKIDNTLKNLNRVPAPQRKALAEVPDAENAKDALDQLIAALRHEHIQVIREFGRETAEAKRVEEALAAAYEQRSGMVFIRPSAAYLKSSYPSTALQADPRLGWQNMLGQHGYRSLPFIGGAFADVGSSREDLRIQSEIDKQFWQTINSVRVAGAGKTNYVIAKDDIGNWYVKGYSADPSDIIQSARNLALFSLGPQLGTDVLGRQLKKDAGEDPGTAGAQLTQLQRVYLKFQDRYNEETTTTYKKLIEDLDEKTVATRIREKWTKNDCYEATDGCGEGLKAQIDKVTGDANVLAEAKSEMEEKVAEVEDKTKDDDEDDKRKRKVSKVARQKGAQIIVGLQATRRFHDALASKVREADLTKPARESLGKAKKENDTQKMKVAEFLSERQSISSALLEALGADPPKEAVAEQLRKDLSENETKLTGAREEAAKAETAFSEAEVKLTNAQKAEASALSDARDVIEGLVKRKTNSRIALVDDLDRALLFLGTAISAEEPEDEDDDADETTAAAASDSGSAGTNGGQ